MSAEVATASALALQYINRLKVAQLKAILKDLNLSTAGLKASLTERLREYVNTLTRQSALQDLLYFNRSCEREMNPVATTPSFPARNNVPYRSGANGAAPPYHLPTTSARAAAQVPKVQVTFATSPFYRIERMLADPMMFMIRDFFGQRLSLARTFVLTQPDIDGLTSGALKVYIISGEFRSTSPTPSLIVQFPPQIEMRVNGETLHVNTKGLKNKPGTARPADCTEPVLRQNAKNRPRNSVEITVGLPKDQQNFTLCVFLVRPSSTQEIVRTITSRPPLTKESVIRRIQEENDDDEVEAMSTTHKLKDPVSCGRIVVPIRSSRCTHVDCFDAESFIMLQMQAPTWTCTICNKPADFESLAVDEYIQDVLSSTSEDLEEFEVEPNGSWKIPNNAAELGIKNEEDSEEELFLRARRAQAARNQLYRRSMQGTSVSPIVVEMLSDDDDESDEAIRGPTRQNGNVAVSLSANQDTSTAAAAATSQQSQITGVPYDRQSEIVRDSVARLLQQQQQPEQAAERPRLMDFGYSMFNSSSPAMSESVPPANGNDASYNRMHITGSNSRPVSTGAMFADGQSSLYGRQDFNRTQPSLTELQLPGGGRLREPSSTPQPPVLSSNSLRGSTADLQNGANSPLALSPLPYSTSIRNFQRQPAVNRSRGSEVIDLTLSDDD